MKKLITITALMFFVSLFIQGNLAALPKEIQADRYMVTVKMYLDKNNHEKALEYMQKIVGLDVKMPPAFYFKYGKSLKVVGKTNLALKQIEKYLELAGRSGKYYQEALILYTQLEQQNIQFIFDISTDLMWQKGDPGEMKWQKAMDYCRNLNLAGYSDWRLPDKDEVKSAYRIKHKFPKKHSSGYWSSTTYTRGTNHAWYVHFLYDGKVDFSYKTNTYYVRCVRDGQ